MLPKEDSTRLELGDRLGIIDALDEMQVFGEKDVAVLKPLRDGRLQFSIWPTDSAPPWVEEIIAAKRAAFLRVPRAKGSGRKTNDGHSEH